MIHITSKMRALQLIVLLSSPIWAVVHGLAIDDDDSLCADCSQNEFSCAVSRTFKGYVACFFIGFLAYVYSSILLCDKKLVRESKEIIHKGKRLEAKEMNLVAISVAVETSDSGETVVGALIELFLPDDHPSSNCANSLLGSPLYKWDPTTLSYKWTSSTPLYKWVPMDLSQLQLMTDDLSSTPYNKSSITIFRDKTGNCFPSTVRLRNRNTMKRLPVSLLTVYQLPENKKSIVVVNPLEKYGLFSNLKCDRRELSTIQALLTWIGNIRWNQRVILDYFAYNQSQQTTNFNIGSLLLPICLVGTQILAFCYAWLVVGIDYKTKHDIIHSTVEVTFESPVILPERSYHS